MPSDDGDYEPSSSGGEGDERWRLDYLARLEAQRQAADSDGSEDSEKGSEEDSEEDSEEESNHEEGTWGIMDTEPKRGRHSSEALDEEPSDDNKEEATGALDTNARGEAVPWSKAGAVDPGNILPSGRRRRGVKARCFNFPLVNSLDALDE